MNEPFANLSLEEKRQLLQKTLQERAGGREQIYPISAFQKGMLFLSQLRPESPQYHITHLLRLRKNLDLFALEQSIAEICKRHPSLRTLFHIDEDGQARQIVQPYQAVPVPIHDLRLLPQDDRERQAYHFIKDAEQVPFQLTREFPFRYQVLRLQDEEYWLFCLFHHIVFDMLSLEIFLRELGLFYESFSSKRSRPELPALSSYGQFARWQEQWLRSEEARTQLAYWKQQLASPLPEPVLPLSRPQNGDLSGKGEQVSRPLSASLSEQIQQIGREEGATLFMTMLAAFNVLLYRCTQQDDILIGTPVAYRNRAEFIPQIGLFLNTLVLRTDLTGQPDFRTVLARTNRVVLDALGNQDIPFPQLVEVLQPERPVGHNPFFRILFALENLSLDIHLPGLEATMLEHFSGTTKFALTLYIREQKGQLITTFEYSPDLFMQEDIERLAGYFHTLLDACTRHPDLPIAYLPLLSPAEQAAVLSQWQKTDQYFPESVYALHSFVEKQAKYRPNAIAIICEDHYLSYQGLNERANQLAHVLISQGIMAETPVALALDRSVEMIVALLAVLKAGGAYVPLDLSFPAERLVYMLDDANASILLTQAQALPLFAASMRVVIALDRDWSLYAQQPVENPGIEVLPDQLAYIIYTSGSTGQPKGVMISHSNLTNYAQSLNSRLEGQPLHFATVSTLAADLGNTSVFSALTTGGCLHILPYETVTSAEAFIHEMQQKPVDVLKVVPTHLSALLTYGNGRDVLPRRYLLLGGEVFSRTLLTRLRDSGASCQIMNHYGPSETTIGVLLNPLTDLERLQNESVPLGRPFANTRVYILDSSLQPVAPGIAGELYIGGLQVGRGYFNRPDSTAERFIPDPFSLYPGARLYRTGDLVRYQTNGEIIFLARVDHQIKLRGFRVDLGEIEAALSQHVLIQDVIVLLDEATPGEPQLVAYLIVTPQKHPDDNELRTFLKRKLPAHMVPTYFIMLNVFPLTRNGKIDRRALSHICLHSKEREALAPRGAFLNAYGYQMPRAPHSEVRSLPASSHNPIEQTLLTIWQRTLRREQIDTHANFFDLGGHSLLIMQVQQQIHQELSVELKLIDLFNYTTINTLARHISSVLGQVSPSQSLAAQAATSVLPLKQGQERDIAIIGMAGRFPGAQNIDAFWENLREGVESLKRFSLEELLEEGIDPALLDDPDYIPVKGILEDATLFDAAFFGITPRDAEIMDPQQRVFLECAWEALEHAGYIPEHSSARIGVYAGSHLSSYYLHNLYPNKAYIRMVGQYQVSITNDKDFLASRTAYKLNLKGPAVAIQTACSSSLVAIHMACQSLLSGDCELALAGGAAIHVPLKEGYLYRQGEIMSADGHCRAFDSKASGTVGADGVGLVVLKPLAQALRDRDTIHAVIKGSAINNDGSQKIGYTAPGPEGQAEAITRALRLAGVGPEDISYVETHGTGTPIGDPIEIEALTKAFRACGTRRNHYCALGSVKTNIGHLDPAAGVAGLIKTVLALTHEQLPPSLHFEQPNPAINFMRSPFFVNNRLTPWRSDRTSPRRAGVSSFGIGGTNAHVVVEEAPRGSSERFPRPWQLLLLSARSETALEAATANLLQHLQAHAEYQLVDIATTSQIGRRAFHYRRAVLCQNREEAISVLSSKDHQQMYTGQALKNPTTVFLFPGQGAQYATMAKAVYTSEAVFRDQVDFCAQYLTPLLGIDLRDILFPDDDQLESASTLLNETRFTQPALFIIEYALAQLWMSWGIQPEAMIGHSIGEYVAACLANTFSLEDALRLVAARGKILQACPRGSMLAVKLPEEEILPLLPDTLSLAAINAPLACVITGPEDAVAAFQARIAQQGVECRLLHTSHAFHSSLVEPALEPFLLEVQKVTLAPPTRPFISNVSGNWISAQQATDPHYWVQHLRNPVRFAAGLHTLIAHSFQVFLEVGPGHTLSTFTRQHSAYNPAYLVLSSLPHVRDKQPALSLLYKTLGRLWLIGLPVDWERFAASCAAYRVPLPSYPFERQRFWVEPLPQRQDSDQTALSNQASTAKQEIAHYDMSEQQEVNAEADSEIISLLTGIWQEILGITPGLHDNFFEIGGDSLHISRIVNRLSGILSIHLPLNLFFEAQTIASQAQQLEGLLLEHIEQAERQETSGSKGL